ncbi:MAG: DUF6438 domain-containing protein [Flavobacterium sp.]
MKNVIAILILAVFVSCQKGKQNHLQNQNGTNTENPCIGNWYFDKIVNYDTSKTKFSKGYLERFHGNYYSFAILNDSILDYKNGFYCRILNRTSYYLGTKTHYRIKDSLLAYFDLSDNEWKNITIKKINGDTMTVVGDENVEYQLVKKNKTYFNNKNYDAIIVDRSPCYGTCPFNSTYIDRKGNFFFKAYDYNTQKGNFMAKLDKETTVAFFNDFDKIDIFNLKDNYSIMATDSQTNIISFVKNGKIVKTIRSYIECPIDLNKAMTKLSYAYQKVKLNHDYESMYVFNSKVEFYRYEAKGIGYNLLESESFFLENEIRKGTKVELKFPEKYELDFNTYNFSDEKGKESNVKKIMTDGRYYKFINKDNTSFIIDIGYDFIDRNPIIKKKRIF